jgi:hypothetical protein
MIKCTSLVSTKEDIIVSASQKQLKANRRKALKSTGPKTDGGKASSAQNARRHGLLAKAVAAGSEDEKAFLDLVSSLSEEFNPASELEQQLVQKLAIAFWRDRRLATAERIAMEAEIVRNREESWASDAARLRASQGVLEVKDSLLFGRYQVMVTNEIKRTLAMLREEQSLRLKTIEGEVIEGVIEKKAAA